MVFNTTTNSFWYFDETVWAEVDSAGVADSIWAYDVDIDMRVEVEQTPDNNQIVFSMGDTEYFRMNRMRMEVLNSGQSVFPDEGAGANDDLYNNQYVAV